MICWKGRDNCEPPQYVSRKKKDLRMPSQALLTWISVGIKKQLTPRSYAYVYVAPGLHSYKRDISISIRKWKRILFLMFMLKLTSLPVYTAFAVLMYMLMLMAYTCAHAYSAVTLWNVSCNLSRNVLATLWHILQQNIARQVARNISV